MAFLLMCDSEGNYIHKDLEIVRPKDGNYSISVKKSGDQKESKSKEVKKRFVEKENESTNVSEYRIVVDVVTGVNYLETSRGGITPLLDKNGEVCIDKKNEK